MQNIFDQRDGLKTQTRHRSSIKEVQEPMISVKEEAKKMIDQLPDHATWDDIMYEIYVKKKLAIAMKAAEEGRVVPHEEVKKRILSK